MKKVVLLMYSGGLCLCLCLCLLQLFLYINISSGATADPIHHSCSDDTKAKDHPQISRNIDTLLPKLVSGAIQNGFIATSYGGAQSQVFGLAQCRQDISKSDCSACIQDTANNIRQLCPIQGDARIWYDYCLLRYKEEKFFGEVDTSGIYYYNTASATDPNTFNQKLGALMDTIRPDAVKPGNKGLGKGKTKISPLVTLYGLVQCTGDLSELNCAQCLAIGISNFERFCKDKIGCRVVYSSCYIRYEVYPFYFPLDATEKAELAADRTSMTNYGSSVAYKN